MLDPSAGPADFNPVHLLCFAESEVQRQHHLRRITRASLHLPHHRFPSGGEPYIGADRIPVTQRSNELQFDRIADLFQVVQVEHRRVVVGIHNQVQLAIVIKISHRYTAPVLGTVGAHRPRNVDELSVADIREQALVFITVPGVITDKFMTEEKPLLVLVNLRDRAGSKGQSKIIFTLVCDPSVGRVNIEIGVVVGVEESDTPAPACARCVAVFQFAKRTVAIVFEE